jgi:Fic family protein
MEQRQYQKSHPWITFSCDTTRAPAKLWALLGEAASKCEHVAGVPLAPSTSKDLHMLYLAKGVRATTAIEGNTLSEKEVVARIEGKKELPPSKEYLGTEVDNIVNACHEILVGIRSSNPDTLTPQRIKDFNRQILKGLTLDEGVIAGEIRTYYVGVGRYRAVPAEDCEYLLDKLCKWLGEPSTGADWLSEIHVAILKAVLGHLYLAWIHPFGDGNGRTARLVEYEILVGAGVSTPAAHLLSNHYNLTRNEYYRQLDYASQSGGDVFQFLIYALQGFVDGLGEQTGIIRVQQLKVCWINYVYDMFAHKKSEADRRRRDLVLDMSERDDGLELKDIDQVSTRIAKRYALLTQRAVMRDLNVLKKMELVSKGKDGKWVARKDRILAFLPIRKKITPGSSRSTMSDAQAVK